MGLLGRDVALCPQLARADIMAERVTSGFNPTRTLTALHRLRCIISRSPLLQRREPCPMSRIVDRAANSRKRSVRTNQSQVFISYSRNDISEGRSMTATPVAGFVNVVGRARRQFTVENDSSR